MSQNIYYRLSENSVRVTYIIRNQFEGFRIICDGMKRRLDMFVLNTNFTLEVESKEDLGMRFRLIIFLIELKLTCPNFSCQISQDSMFKAKGIETFIIRRIDYIKTEKTITNNFFSMKILYFRHYKFIWFLDNPIAALRRDDSLIRFLQSEGTFRTLWRVKIF